MNKRIACVAMLICAQLPSIAVPQTVVDRLSGVNFLLLDGDNEPNYQSSPSHKPISKNSSPLNPPNGYWEYLPEDYENTTASPLLIFYHGISQNGNGSSELNLLLQYGPPRLINEGNWASEHPFVVLSPQHGGVLCPSANEINTFIQFAKTHYDIDSSRIYLTGLSCGAIGIWSYLGQYLNTDVAAAAPIAGDGKAAWESQGCNLAQLAIWAFHGDADPTVSVSGTNIPMDGLLECSKPPAKETIKTIYPGVAHNSWTQTYDGSAGHDIYYWLLGKQKSP